MSNMCPQTLLNVLLLMNTLLAFLNTPTLLGSDLVVIYDPSSSCVDRISSEFDCFEPKQTISRDIIPFTSPFCTSSLVFS
jgi:hypothetical protein